MTHKAISAAALAVLLLAAGGARAGVYADDLAKCLVRSTSETDQTNLIIWIYGAISAHPDVRTYSSLTDQQHAAITKTAGDLYTRLMTVDCRAETIAAIKNEGNAALESSFNVLGQVAMRGLMREPNVQGEIGKLVRSSDQAKIAAMLKEAGVAGPGAVPKP